VRREELRERFRAICGEDLPLPGGGATERRHRRLMEVGREDLSLAKLAEAHWDAVAILAEAGDVIAYPPDGPLDEASIRRAAEGCTGIVSQLMDPIRETVLSTPGLKIVSNVAVGFDNIDLEGDQRTGAQILRDLGVRRMRLMAAPRKMPSMAGFGLEVTGYDDLSAAAGANEIRVASPVQ